MFNEVMIENKFNFDMRVTPFVRQGRAALWKAQCWSSIVESIGSIGKHWKYRKVPCWSRHCLKPNFVSRFES